MASPSIRSRNCTNPTEMASATRTPTSPRRTFTVSQLHHQRANHVARGGNAESDDKHVTSAGPDASAGEDAARGADGEMREHADGERCPDGRARGEHEKRNERDDRAERGRRAG